MPIHDVNAAARYIFSQTEDDVNIILGTVIDKSMNGMIQATIIATDFADSLALKSPVVEAPKSTVTVSKGFNFEAPKSQPPPQNTFQLPTFNFRPRDTK